MEVYEGVKWYLSVGYNSDSSFRVSLKSIIEHAMMTESIIKLSRKAQKRCIIRESLVDMPPAVEISLVEIPVIILIG